MFDREAGVARQVATSAFKKCNLDNDKGVLRRAKWCFQYNIQISLLLDGLENIWNSLEDTVR